jgi:hypothetical protein
MFEKQVYFGKKNIFRNHAYPFQLSFGQDSRTEMTKALIYTEEPMNK